MNQTAVAESIPKLSPFDFASLAEGSKARVETGHSTSPQFPPASKWNVWTHDDSKRKLQQRDNIHDIDRSLENEKKKTDIEMISVNHPFAEPGKGSLLRQQFDDMPELIPVESCAASASSVSALADHVQVKHDIPNQPMAEPGVGGLKAKYTVRFLE